ncbi:MAG: TetR-like C-terminal domain-containing protein, partial [Clostridiaceae bacterium]
VEEAVRLLITPVENNSNIIMKLLNSQRRDETLRLLISTINTYMVNMVERKSLFMDMKRSDLDMTLNFFTFAMVGILLDIAYKQKPVDYDLIAHQIYLLVTGQMVKPGELQ